MGRKSNVNSNVEQRCSNAPCVYASRLGIRLFLKSLIRDTHIQGAFKHAAWTPNLGVDICFIRGASAPARLQQAPARHHTPTSRGDDASPRPTDIGRQPRQRCQSGRGLHSTALRMTRPSSPASNGGSNESFFSTNKSACSCVAAKQSWRPRANPTLKPTSGANKSQGRATLHSPANVRDPSTGI